METITTNIQIRTDKLQKEMNNFIEEIKNYSNNKNLSYQDIANTFLLLKLSKIMEDIEQIKSAINS